MALSAIGVGQATQTPVGLSGREVLNLDLTNLAMRNKKLLELAKLSGAAKMEQKGRTGDLIQQSSAFVGNAMSSGMLNGLFSSGASPAATVGTSTAKSYNPQQYGNTAW
jgi:hypothetical protein